MGAWGAIKAFWGVREPALVPGLEASREGARVVFPAGGGPAGDLVVFPGVALGAEALVASRDQCLAGFPVATAECPACRGGRPRCRLNMSSWW